MALSRIVSDARVREVAEASKLRIDQEFVEYIQLGCDRELIALNGTDAPLLDPAGRVVSQSAISYWLATKERMVAVLARRRGGVPRRHMFDCD